jgi:hypothetical protein
MKGQPQQYSSVPRHLHSTQNLLGRLNLTGAYDTYVRPFVRPVGEPPPEKGKAREKDGDVLVLPGSEGNPVSQTHRIPHGLKAFLIDVPGSF